MKTREAFLRDLRDALSHLRDPENLRESPLADLFGVADRFDTFTALQRILTEAVKSLEPGASEPSQSRAWRIYESLYYRYVQQFSPAEVADQLGIGTRQLRREQHAGLEALAERLWIEYDLENTWPQHAATGAVPAQALDQEDNADLVSELSWLRECSIETPTDLGQSLQGAMDLGQKLADRYAIRLELAAPESLPCLAVHPVALGQILLDLLSVAIHRASGDRVCVEVQPIQYEVEIQVRGTGPVGASCSTSRGDASSLDMARRMVGLCGGRLHLADGEEAFSATLVLPVFEQMAVLVIDDSADTQQLLQRYVVGTRYRVVSARDPGQALRVAEAVSPRIIVLDVMMPQIDGWKVLARLRQHPLTENVPIIVCTIMSQEELALTLGASDYVRKPVSRQDFLSALDRVALMAPGSR